MIMIMIVSQILYNNNNNTANIVYNTYAEQNKSVKAVVPNTLNKSLALQNFGFYLKTV